MGKTGNQRESFRWYFAGGIIAVWFSNAALFVFAGLSFALMIVFIVRREYVDLRSLLFGGMVWAVNVAVVYFAFLRNSQQNGFLYQYWEEGFAPFPPWKNISWYLTLLKNVANEPLGLQTGLRATWIFYVLLAVGVIRLSIKRWEGTLLILGPIAVTCGGFDASDLSISGTVDLIFGTTFLFVDGFRVRGSL
jgi:hypothetical protein